MALNADDILKEQFPDNVSISDLCDCGKHKRKHHGPPPIPRKSVPLPETDYQSTFKGTIQRPRSSKRPVSEVIRTNIPKEPMFFDTNQRSDFKSHGQIERTKPIIPEEKFEQSLAKVDGITSYTQEFIPKQLQPEYRRMEPRANYVPSNAKFENLTTNKEYYKKWVPTKLVPFGELPSFTGSILYPQMKEKIPETVTQNSFKGEFVKRPDAIRLAEANIKMEGDMFMNTTNHDTFTRHEGDHRVKRTTHTPTLKVGRALGKFENLTQNRRDFPEYPHPESIKAQAAQPAPCTIDLKFDNKRSLITEQKDTFKGHDVLINPMVKAIRTDYAEYNPPTVKFETETSNKRDYVPKEIPKMMTRPPPEGQLRRRDDKFDDRTMFKEFFQNWSPHTRVRYGDFHENRPYVPPQTKFEHDSVTHTSFTPKKYEPVKDFRPEQNQISTEGKIDFGTVHRQTYVKPVVKPCRAQLFLLQRELKKLKREREGSAPPTISAK